MDLDEAREIVNDWEKRLREIISVNNGYTNFMMDRKGAEAILFLNNELMRLQWIDKTLLKAIKEGVEGKY